MNNQRRPRIPDAEWESWKDKIDDLYLKQDRPLEGPDGVMSIMAREHEFSASKAQYETRLKRWKFRKYAKKNDWLTLSHVLGSRKQEGKSTDVFFDGKLVPPDRLRKEMRRHQVRNQHCNPQGYALPSHIRVRTPPLSHSTLGCQNRAMSSWQHPSFPVPSTWVESSVGIPSAVLAETEQCTTNATCNNPGFLNLPTNFDSSWDSLPNNGLFSGPSTRFDMADMSNYTEFMSFQENGGLGRSYGICDGSTLANSALPMILMPRLATRSAYTLPDFSTSMDQLFQKMLPGVESFVRSIHIPDSIISEFSTKRLRHPNDSQLQHTRHLHKHILHLVFSRLVNNKETRSYGDNSESAIDIVYQLGVRYLCSLDAQLLGNILDMIPYPYITALHLGLLYAAFKLQAVDTTETILERHFDPAIDVDLGEINDEASFPILLHPKILRTLLQYGVEPDFIATILLNRWSYTYVPTFEYMATSNFFTSKESPKTFMNQVLPANLEIFEQLLQNGASIEDIRTNDLFSYGPAEVILVVFKHYIHQFDEIIIEKKGLENMMRRDDWNHRLDMALKTILEYDHVTDSNGWKYVLATSLSVAILRGRDTAINLLVAAGALPNSRCLIHAVTSRNSRLFQQCLDLGVDPNTPHSQDYDENYDEDCLSDTSRCTAFSECIRLEDEEAIQKLTETRYIDGLRNNKLGLKLALTEACRAANQELVSLLLSLRNDNHSENEYDDVSNNTILAAVQSGSLAIVCHLLTAGFIPRYSAILSAVRRRQPSIPELLISVTSYDPRGYSWSGKYMDLTLFEATRWGNIDVIEALLRVGSPLNTEAAFNFDENERNSILPRRLRDHSSRVQWKGTALSMAILIGNSKVTELLLKSGAEPCVRILDREDSFSDRIVRSMTALTACVIRDDLKLVQEMFSRGADPFDNSAIYVASVLQNDRILEVLLDAFTQRYSHGARDFGSDALFEAILQGNNRMLELLVKHADAHSCVIARAHRNTYDFEHKMKISPFGEAIFQYHKHHRCFHALQILLQEQEDLDIVVYVNHGSLTALQFAIELESLAIVKLLVESGASVSPRPRSGRHQTSLQAAAMKGSVQIVKYLLEQGSDPNEAPGVHRGATALQYAAIEGSVEVATVLLDKHANVNADPALLRGRTAFEGAAEHGRIEMMLLLFQRGADLLANDRRQYQRAIYFATRNCQLAAKRFADELLETAVKHEQLRQFEGGDLGTMGLDMDSFIDFSSFS